MDGTGRVTDDEALAYAENLISLGSEIRQVRKARLLTLKDLAEATGISVSHLSAIERSATNPSLEVINKIADALNIDPHWFFARRPGAGPMERAYVVRKRNRRGLNDMYGEGKDQAGLVDELASSSMAGKILMGISEYQPRSERADGALYQYKGELHGYIVKGTLELQLGAELIELQEDDSFSFPTEIVHKVRNRTGEPAKLIWVIGEMVLPPNILVKAQREREEPEQGAA